MGDRVRVVETGSERYECSLVVTDEREPLVPERPRQTSLAMVRLE